MTKRHLTIATRESPLALQQAEIIKTLLMSHHPHLTVDLLGITTQADRMLDVNLIEIGGKGLFVKELEEALLAGRADIAVHSMKDVPMELPPGLTIPVIGKREQPRDVFVSNLYKSIFEMPRGAIVGTSSLRRQTQLQALRPDLTWRDLRGNINTRLRKLDQEEYDGIVLAAAGLLRLGLNDRIKEYFSIEQLLPSAGQGALGIECLEEATQIKELIAPLNDTATSICVTAERALCRRLGGGCKLPVAAFAQLHHETLCLHGLVANHNGARILRVRREGKPQDADSLGKRCAEELLQQGAAEILEEYKT